MVNRLLSGVVFIMKILKVKGYDVKVDDDLYELLNSKKWKIVSRGDGYVRDSYGRYMHRLIMGVTDPEVFVDHIDRDTFNNQRSNLRLCNRLENSYNRTNVSCGKSKYVGVFPAYVSKKTGIKRWYAKTTINKKRKIIGYFKTEEEAALAYNNEIIKHRGEFVSLNIISHP